MADDNNNNDDIIRRIDEIMEMDNEGKKKNNYNQLICRYQEILTNIKK